jgi:hypothetical protein
MESHSTCGPYKTVYKNSMTACLVILDAISCAQATPSMSYEDHKWLLLSKIGCTLNIWL